MLLYELIIDTKKESKAIIIWNAIYIIFSNNICTKQIAIGFISMIYIQSISNSKVHNLQLEFTKR